MSPFSSGFYRCYFSSTGFLLHTHNDVHTQNTTQQNFYLCIITRLAYLSLTQKQQRAPERARCQADFLTLSFLKHRPTCALEKTKMEFWKENLEKYLERIERERESREKMRYFTLGVLITVVTVGRSAESRREVSSYVYFLFPFSITCKTKTYSTLRFRREWSWWIIWDQRQKIKWNLLF